MKKRFVLKETGEELKLGSPFRTIVNLEHASGWTETLVKDTLVDEELIAGLLKSGYIVEEIVKDDISMDIDFYVDAITARLKTKVSNSTESLAMLSTNYGNALNLMIIKEIANAMYSGTEYKLNDSDEVYLISPDTGRYYKTKGKSLRCNPWAAVFYSLEDVKKACWIIKPIFTPYEGV